MSNELQLGQDNGLQVTSLQDVFKLAECLVKAGDFIPAHFQKNASAVAAAIITGQELGLSPMASMRGLYVVKGKVGVSYDVMIGLLRKHEYRIKWPEFDKHGAEANNAEIATFVLTHKDGTEMKSVYTKKDATSAGLWGKNTWAAHPKTMLRARAVTNAVKSFAGEVLSGVYTIDEVKEIEQREEKVVQVPASTTSGKQTLLTALKAKHQETQEVNVIHEETNEVKGSLEVQGEVVDAFDEDGVLSDSFTMLNDMLDEAKTAADLELAVEKIKSAFVSDDERERLGAKYLEVKKTIQEVKEC